MFCGAKHVLAFRTETLFFNYGSRATREGFCGLCPHPPSLRCRYGRRLVCAPLAHGALLKKGDENFTF